MAPRFLVLCVLLACGGSDETGGAPVAPGGSSGGSSAEEPTVTSEDLRALVSLAADGTSREEALQLTEAIGGDLGGASEERRAAVARAMGAAFLAIEGTAPIDHRLRIALLRGLDATESDAAKVPLTAIALRIDADQNFLFNRLALETMMPQVGASDVDALVQALFLYPPWNPAMRMNDLAASAIARVGEPALRPLLAVLAGSHPEARALATAYVEALEERADGAFEVPSAASVMKQQAFDALGLLGHAGALQPLLVESRGSDPLARVGAVMALVSLSPSLDDRAPVREAIIRVYEAATDVRQKAQLVASARRAMDGALADFFVRVAADEDEDPSVRLQAAEAFALVASAEQTAAFRRVVRSAGPIEPQVAALEPALREAERCAALACWVEAFGAHARDGDALLARKAAAMLAQLGRDDQRAISALVAQLGHRDMTIRLAALRALDWVAIRGSRAAVERIDELGESEAGRAIWTQFAREAIPVQGRLVARRR